MKNTPATLHPSPYTRHSSPVTLHPSPFTRHLSPFTSLILLLLLTACSGPQVPTHFTDSKTPPKIYPDYAEVTIPVNMAPLNFELLTGADDAVVRFSAAGQELVCGGLKARPDIDEWKSLTAAAAGETVTVEVFAEQNGQWVRFKPFHIYVSRDSIDPWLSYRMISPSYVSYEELTINQRCLETFDEQVIVDNMLCSTEAGGQCVNCHNYQQYNPGRMQFHARQTHGGTVIVYDGQVEKVNMKNDSLLSAGVYPAWHPQQKLIAYSTNKTMQAFHTSDLNKIEVFDSESDLILYDIDRHEVTPIESGPGELEIYPCWSPDGRWLYFCSAHFEYQSGRPDLEEVTMRYQELKYNIYRKSFDPQTHHFGPRELVFAADSSLFTLHSSPVLTDSSPFTLHSSLSATLPRISPDGRWLMFTLGEWGCFHIWHRDADLWLLDLEGKERIDSTAELSSTHPSPFTLHQIPELNSDDTESYHSWSSNGRWVVFSSRRYDSVFTRPFIAHIDADGHSSKPFELPARDPDYHRQLLKSYNVPELMRGPVTLSPQQMAAALKQEGAAVTYSQQQK